MIICEAHISKLAPFNHLQNREHMGLHILGNIVNYYSVKFKFKDIKKYLQSFKEDEIKILILDFILLSEDLEVELHNFFKYWSITGVFQLGNIVDYRPGIDREPDKCLLITAVRNKKVAKSELYGGRTGKEFIESCKDQELYTYFIKEELLNNYDFGDEQLYQISQILSEEPDEKRSLAYFKKPSKNITKFSLPLILDYSKASEMKIIVDDLEQEEIIGTRQATFIRNSIKNFEEVKQWLKNNNGEWPKQVPPSRRGNDKDSNMIILENKLGVWLMSCRSKYRKGALEDEVYGMLSSIDFIWDYRKLQRKNKTKDLIDFISKNSRLPIAKDQFMYGFLTAIIDDYKTRSLNIKLQEKLEEYNFDDWIYNHEKTWFDWIKEIEEFIEINGAPPTFNKNKHSEKVNSMASWLSKAKSDYRGNLLDQEQAAAFTNLGIDMTPRTIKNEIKFEIKLAEFAEFMKINKREPSPQSKNEDERYLAFWILNQRNWYNGSSVNTSEYPAERLNKLLKIGIDLRLTKAQNTIRSNNGDFLI